MDWQRIRSDFPVLDQQVHGHPLVYLDNAASSQKPRQVIDTISRYYERDNANVHRALHELSNRATEAFEQARKKVAKFIGAKTEDEIIFTRGTTEGINLVANTWGAQNLKPGDVILYTGMEHHSNLVPWQLLAQRTGATLRHIPVLDDGTLDLTNIDTLLNEQVKLFTFVHISNSLGTINPAKELIAKARAVGAVTFLDAAQSVGHRPVDVQDLGCDFLAFSGHKMCGPTGIGVLYGRMELLEKMPPWHGGGEMIQVVTLEGSTHKNPPHRFEAGTPDISGVIGLGAAIDYLEAVGLENIQRHDTELSSHAVQQMREIPGIRILGPDGQRASLVAFHLDFAHPHDLVEYANTYGIAMRGGHHCTQPLMKRFKVPGTTRASFYFYNTLEEINRLVEVLYSRVNSSPDRLIEMALSDELRDLYQQVILDHSRSPRNHGELPPPCLHAHGDNPSCGDEIDVWLKVDDKGTIEDLKFKGQGCAISQASASMMTQKIKGKSRDQAAAMREDFRRVVMGDGAPADEDSLGELILLEGVQKFPQRVKCAMLAWRAVEQALEEK